ncbi:MAG: hypothetical protein FWD61_11180 [Phycisphaerales bacterium]|nr:hypothetical protein [Phycisphaerales bacterium]
MKKSHAAVTFHVSRSSIDAWLAAVENSGDGALVSRKRGPRPEPRLKARQIKSLIALITGGCPKPATICSRLQTPCMLKRSVH